MGFVRLDDNLPAPQAYLRAGLLRPQSGPGSLGVLADNRVGSWADAERMVRTAAPPAVGSQTMTVVDDEGRPQAVVAVPSGQFLARPFVAESLLGAVVEVVRAPNGMPVVRREQDSLGPGCPIPTPVDAATARVVTIDLSVLLAGIEPALFRPDDAIFVSAALALETAVILGERREYGRWEGVKSYNAWDRSIPVPIDHAVLRMYAQLAGQVRLRDSTELDRTDLLCAATAIIYEAPLYTTKPDAYRPLKNGLRVLPYGSVRTKGAARAPRPVVVEIPEDPAEAATALREGYARGEQFYGPNLARLWAACGDPDALAAALTEVLEAVRDDLDPTWRYGILTIAKALRPTIRAASDQARADLLLAVAQLDSIRPQGYVDQAREKQADAALDAYGHWGIWPQDASDDVLGSLEDGSDDESTLRWYRVYLMMVGLDQEDVDREVESAHAGRSQPSRARITELSAPQP